jgi:hypothetical protein
MHELVVATGESRIWHKDRALGIIAWEQRSELTLVHVDATNFGWPMTSHDPSAQEDSGRDSHLTGLPNENWIELYKSFRHPSLPA